MLRLRLHRQWLTWALLGAMALAVLAPGVARALAALRGDAQPWAVVCTVEAERAKGNGQPTEPAHTLSHCPFCHLHSDALALPPTALPAVALLRLSQAVPALFLQSARPLVAWASAQARAPPPAA